MEVTHRSQWHLATTHPLLRYWKLSETWIEVVISKDLGSCYWILTGSSAVTVGKQTYSEISCAVLKHVPQGTKSKIPSFAQGHNVLFFVNHHQWTRIRLVHKSLLPIKWSVCKVHRVPEKLCKPSLDQSKITGGFYLATWAETDVQTPFC